MNAPSGPATGPAVTGKRSATRPATPATASPATVPDRLADSELFEAMLPSVPCEHPDHGTGSPFHRDGNPYYARYIGGCGHYGPPIGMIVVVCFEWLATLRGMYCPDCDITWPAGDVVEIIGPVASFHS